MRGVKLSYLAELLFVLILLNAPTGCTKVSTVIHTDKPDLLMQTSSPETVLGAPLAPLKVAVFHDTNCGMCRKMWRELISDTLKTPLAEGKVQVRFFEYPLGLDPKSSAIAINAKCAAEQGKYKQFLTAAYTTKGEHGPDDLTRLSKMATLDLEVVSNCINSGRPKKAVSNDIAVGRSLKVEGTPTFFVDGKQLKANWTEKETWNALLGR